MKQMQRASSSVVFLCRICSFSDIGILVKRWELLTCPNALFLVNELVIEVDFWLNITTFSQDQRR